MGKKVPLSIGERALLESETSILNTFDFLGTDSVVDDEDEDENLRLVRRWEI